MVSCQKDLNYFQGQCSSDHATAQAKQVHIIIFNALMGRIAFMDQSRADPWYFVSREAGAHATAADGDAALQFTARDCPGQRDDKVREIIFRI